MLTFTMRFLKPLNGVLSCLTTREDASCEVASIYWFAQRLAMAHQIHPNLSFVSAEFVGGTEPDTRMHRRKDEPAVKQEVGSLARCVGGHPTFESSMSFQPRIQIWILIAFGEAFRLFKPSPQKCLSLLRIFRMCQNWAPKALTDNTLDKHG